MHQPLKGSSRSGVGVPTVTQLCISCSQETLKPWSWTMTDNFQIQMSSTSELCGKPPTKLWVATRGTQVRCRRHCKGFESGTDTEATTRRGLLGTQTLNPTRPIPAKTNTGEPGEAQGLGALVPTPCSQKSKYSLNSQPLVSAMSRPRSQPIVVCVALQ